MPCSPFPPPLAVNRRDGLVSGYEFKCGGGTEDGYVCGDGGNVVPTVDCCRLGVAVGLANPFAAKTDCGIAWINCSSCLMRASIPAVFFDFWPFFPFSSKVHAEPDEMHA